MTAEYLLINNGSYRKAVKAISKCLPKFDIKPSFALKLCLISLKNLVKNLVDYIRHRNHKYDLCLRIHDYHEVKRSFLDILFYMQVKGK